MPGRPTASTCAGSSSTAPAAQPTTGSCSRGGASLNIEDSVIRNFAAGMGGNGNGIIVDTNASALFVSNTVIADNDNSALSIVSGSVSVTVVLSNVSVVRNGLNVSSPISLYTNGTGSITVTIVDSAIANNSQPAVLAESMAAGVGALNVLVKNCTISNNITGIQTFKGGAGVPTIRVSGSTITGNGNGLVSGGGAQLLSYGDNNLDGNGTDGAFTGTIPRK